MNKQCKRCGTHKELSAYEVVLTHFICEMCRKENGPTAKGHDTTIKDMEFQLPSPETIDRKPVHAASDIVLFHAIRETLRGDGIINKRYCGAYDWEERKRTSSKIPGWPHEPCQRQVPYKTHWEPKVFQNGMNPYANTRYVAWKDSSIDSEIEQYKDQYISRKAKVWDEQNPVI